MRLFSRFVSPAAIEKWWVKTPGQLRVYSKTLWAVWSDGIYLTAWPRAALLLPCMALLLGIVEGATHWSLLTIGNDTVDVSFAAVIFAQFLPLLFVAVLLGSSSAHLGLMVVSGYALGDYLIAGPFLTISNWNPISGFLCLRVPQLLCYFLFFAVAAAPAIAGSALLHPFSRRLAGDRLFSLIVRTAALAAVTMTLVYGWTLVAPLVFRMVWSWAGQGPPISVKYFREVLNPWLPITAGIGIVIRNVLVWRTRNDERLQERTRRLFNEAALVDRRTAWPRHLPPWFRALLTAAWSAFLLVGMMTTWPVAALVCTGLMTLFLLRNCILPKVAMWARWTRKITAVPLIFRLALVVGASYFSTRELLHIPGWAISQNSTPGQFGILLACAAASLLTNLFVIPYAPEGSVATTQSVSVPLATPAIRVAVQVLLLVLFLFLPLHAFAVCMDPSCCFGADSGGADGPFGALGGGFGLGGGGGIGGSGEGGPGSEGGGPDGGPEGGGDEPAPSSNGGPSGEGGGGSSASGSSSDQGSGNAGSFGSASSPGDSGSSGPGSTSDQGSGNAGPGSLSSPGDSGSSAPGSSSDQGSGNAGSGSASSPGDSGSSGQSSTSDQGSGNAGPGSASSPGDSGSSGPGTGSDQGSDNASSPGSESSSNPSNSSPGLTPDDSGSDDQQQLANDLSQDAARNQIAANDFQQQVSDDQQEANDLNQLADQAQDPSDVAKLRQAANDETQQAADAQQLANEASSDAQKESNAAAQIRADEATTNGTQGTTTNQPPPPPQEYVGPKKP